MNIIEKILAKKSGKEEVHPGEFLWAEVDFGLGNDITAPLAIKEFRAAGGKRVKYPDRFALIPDHFTPAKDIKSAAQVKILRDFAKEHELKYFFEIGKAGIEHVLIPEQGLVLPGELVIGADSHTCTYGALGCLSTGVGSTDLASFMLTGGLWFRVPRTLKIMYHGKLNPNVGGKDLILYTIGILGVNGALYKAVEFCGTPVQKLPLSDWFTMCNMVIEFGGKCGYMEPDRRVLEYAKRNPKRKYEVLYNDDGTEYEKIIDIDVKKIFPQVSFPHLPSNAKNVRELKEKVCLDQVVIGSCTNGRIEDLRITSKILRGKKVKVPTLIFPGTQKVYLDALKEGIVKTLIESGCVMNPPTCGPCLGGHLGVLSKGERCLATTNRNFIGRMGDPESEVYLTSPYVAAKSALKGYITEK
ncbi:MAG TPA: 3-isopropylmalate dehydratase large subunit [bacterium]|nr:3-isopropylmalate dehydratase large subunit [bacterium]